MAQWMLHMEASAGMRRVQRGVRAWRRNIESERNSKRHEHHQNVSDIRDERVVLAKDLPVIYKLVRYGFQTGPIWPRNISDHFRGHIGPVWKPFRTTFKTPGKMATVTMIYNDHFYYYGIGFPFNYDQWHARPWDIDTPLKLPMSS